MNTLPIAASDPCSPFTASASQSAPAEAPGFQQVLQQMDSGVTSSAVSNQEANEVSAASYETRNAVSSADVTFSNPSLSSGYLSSASAPGAYGGKHGVPSIVTDSVRKERAAGRTGSLNPKQHAQPSKLAGESNPDNAIPIVANINRAVTPAPAPPAPGLHSSITPPADSAAEPEPKAQPRAATSASTDNHAPASATHDAPAPSDAGQSLPQSADTPTTDSASNLSSSHPLLNLKPELARESAISHSALRASADSSSQPSTRYHIEAGSQPDHFSAVTERTIAAAGQRDPGVGFASAVSAHPSSVSAAAAPLSATAAQSATQPAPQSAVQPAAQATTPSTLFAQPAPAPAPVGSKPQHSSDAIPEPHTIDSGQLRVSPNNSELKISVQLPELGKVEVRAVTAHDVTTAHLTAFRHEALPILTAGRTGLEQALKSRDVLLGSFASNAQGHSAGQQRQHNSPSFTPSAMGAISTPGAPIAAGLETSTNGLLPDYASISLHA